jgi:transposase
MYVIHTGCQWYKLPIDKTADGKPEISYTHLFKHFRAWLKKGCFARLFEASVALLSNNNLLDLSIVHDDSTTIATKKRAITLVSVDINTSRETKLLLFMTETATLLHHLSRLQEIRMNHP